MKSMLYIYQINIKIQAGEA